jgi:hypothetical protein
MPGQLHSVSVAMAEGRHPVPSRTRKLSPLAPMVLPGRPGGRVGRRRDSFEAPPDPGRRFRVPGHSFLRALRGATLRSWFEDSDHIDELLRVETGRVGKRERVGYLFAVTNPDGKFLVEQQAYYETKDGVITWMRVLCSGYQPVPPAGGGAA